MRKNRVAKGKYPLLTWGAKTEDASAEASEGCCSADFATHSLYWQYHHTLQSLPNIFYYNSRKKCSFLRFFITLPSYPPIYL